MRRSLRLVLPLLLGIGALPAALGAQQPATPPPAALQLTVVDAASGEPIGSARVAVAGGIARLSDAAGVVVLRGLAAGSVAGEITHLGYAPRAFAIPLPPGSMLSLSVPMEPRPLPVAGVEVEAEASPYGVMTQALKGFYERAEGGAGYYITREQIDSWNPRQVSDLFRMIPGLGIVHTANGERASMGARSTPTYDTFGRLKECPIQYFVDGSPYEAAGPESLYLDVRPQEIEGIEVYSGTAGLPPQFRRTNRNCGVILIWKRERI